MAGFGPKHNQIGVSSFIVPFQSFGYHKKAINTKYYEKSTNPWSTKPDSKYHHRSLMILKYQNNGTSMEAVVTSPSSSAATTASGSGRGCPMDRFQRQASKIEQVQKEECIITMNEGNRYNLTDWAHAHPGGIKILQRFHTNQKDATKAFEAAHHSQAAQNLLSEFLIVEEDEQGIEDTPHLGKSNDGDTSSVVVKTTKARKPHVLSKLKQKLFTKEDRIGIHKYLGLFVLGNYACRYYQMYFKRHDLACGLGKYGHPWFAFLCLIPHGLLSLSSLIFHTVPKERVVGKPMIWQEYRVHNIIFGMRSVLTAMITSLGIKYGNTGIVRKLAVSLCCTCVIGSLIGADIATHKLRAVEVESTTATMPYWENCSITTQRKFKSFYAYCQFMATLACLAVGNPAWPFCVLLAIQGASLMMTLVRKGLLSTKGYHYGYTATLIAPYFVGLRTMLYTRRPDFAYMVVLAYILFQARRRGVNKYVLWVPVVLGRLFVGDGILTDPQIW